MGSCAQPVPHNQLQERTHPSPTLQVTTVQQMQGTAEAGGLQRLAQAVLLCIK